MRLSRTVVLFYDIIISEDALNQTKIVQPITTFYIIYMYACDSVIVARVNNAVSGFLRLKKNQLFTYQHLETNTCHLKS